MLSEIRGSLQNDLGNVSAVLRRIERGLNTASSKGIGLIKIMPEDKLRVVMEFLTEQSIAAKRRAFPQRTLRALLDTDYISSNERVYDADNGYCFASFERMLQDHLRSI